MTLERFYSIGSTELLLLACTGQGWKAGEGWSETLGDDAAWPAAPQSCVSVDVSTGQLSSGEVFSVLFWSIWSLPEEWNCKRNSSKRFWTYRVHLRQCNCKKTSTNLQKNVEQEEARRSNEPTSTSSYSRDLLPGCHCSAATMQPWAHKRLGSMRRRPAAGRVLGGRKGNKKRQGFSWLSIHVS